MAQDREGAVVDVDETTPCGVPVVELDPEELEVIFEPAVLLAFPRRLEDAQA